MIANQHFDVLIVGGGLAGSAAAAMLSDSPYSIGIVDPQATFKADFRCEALTEGQVDRLRSAGLLDCIKTTLTASGGLWIARRGRIVERRASNLYGFDYSAAVRLLRERSAATLIAGNSLSIETSRDLQLLTLSGGETITARLVILATGPNQRLRRSLGMKHEIISPAHSVALGFDVESSGAFAFPALTVYPRSTKDATSYLTLFRSGDLVRANLFVYRSAKDAWLRDFARTPVPLLQELLPHLEGLIGPYKVTGDVEVRPIDLYASQDFTRDGVVLVGDAFANSCPAAGTGVDKIIVDVEQLCRHHIPAWLASQNISSNQIAKFYNDEIKTTCDNRSLAHAHYAKAIAINGSLIWQALRWRSDLGGRVRQRLSHGR